MAETTEETTTETPPERTVPYARFKEINDKLSEERKQRSELEGRISQLEDADKPHIERLSKDLEKAQKRADDAEKTAADVQSRLQRSEKAAWLSNAAAKLSFHDPEAATLFADLDSIETAGDAEKAVKQIAKDRAYLVKEDVKQAPLAKVGITGPEVETNDQGLVSPADLEKAWGRELLKGLDPSAVSE